MKSEKKSEKYKKTLNNKTNNCSINDYEKLLRQEESNIREYIREQNQLRIYIELIIEKNNELINENITLRKKIVYYIILFLLGK